MPAGSMFFVRWQTVDRDREEAVLPCGTTVKAVRLNHHQFQWELHFVDGIVRTGTTSSLKDAKTRWHCCYRVWAFAKWSQGKLARKGFLVDLKAPVKLR